MLGDYDSPQMMLKVTTDALKGSAQDAAQLAKVVAVAYNDWLGATCKVHAACFQTSTDNELELRANEVHLAAQQVQVHKKARKGLKQPRKT